MKKWISVVLVSTLLFLSMSLIGCSSDSGEQENGTQSDGEKIIGVVMINFTNPFYSSAAEAMEEAAEKLGYELIIKSAEGSVETEISLIENFIQQGVDGILVDAIDKEAIINVFDKADQSDIPVISLFNVVNEGGSNYNCAYDHYTGFKSVSTAIFEKLDGKGNVLLLSGQKGNYASDERERGFNEALEKYPGIKVLANQPSDWDPSKGLNIVQTWLTTYDNIDAILCVSDGITPSIVEAVDAAGRSDEIIIGGNDGEVDVIELMIEDKVVADALLGSKRGGYLSVLYADKVIKGETNEKVEHISTYLIANKQLQELMIANDVDMSWFSVLTPEEALKVANNYKEEYENY